MSEKIKRKKLFRKRKKFEENDENQGIHKIPKDIVEVERNLIENWFLLSRRWLKSNPKLVRTITAAIMLMVILTFIGIFTHSAITESQNEDFIKLYKTFSDVKKMPESEDKKKKFNEILENSQKLCSHFWPTVHAANGCLIEAYTYKELKEFQKHIESLLKFAQYQDSIAVKTYAKFFAAYAYESQYQLQKAAELYNDLEKDFEKIEKNDIILYNKARTFYYQNKIDEAKPLFKKVLADFPNSTYKKDVKNYLLLISLKESKTTKN
ncbi:MAG: hypothetical protein OEZ22_00330 [Spirochaetia bacterium]|nr:hypothetical protein [Spirochaetia bacterium]